MKARSAAERLQYGRQVGEMAALVERYLADEVTEAELQGLVFPTRPHQFRGSADGLYSSIYNLDAKIDGAPLIRRQDLIEQLRFVRRGDPVLFPDQVDLAVVALSAAEIAQRTGVQTERFAEEGIGWFEAVRFASLATGRPFVSCSCLLPADREVRAQVRTWGLPAVPEERAAVVADLFDTLCIDSADARLLCAPLARCWDLMRSDDNGHSYRVSRFTGYAKACARLTQFEASTGKQCYWLEEKALGDDEDRG